VLQIRVSVIAASYKRNIQLRLVVRAFVVSQRELYCQNILLSLLGVLHNPEDKVLVAKSFPSLYPIRFKRIALAID
jgi:hypothetical protein